jgi:hypothetical protein
VAEAVGVHHAVQQVRAALKHRGARHVGRGVVVLPRLRDLPPPRARLAAVKALDGSGEGRRVGERRGAGDDEVPAAAADGVVLPACGARRGAAAALSGGGAALHGTVRWHARKWSPQRGAPRRGTAALRHAAAPPQRIARPRTHTPALVADRGILEALLVDVKAEAAAPGRHEVGQVDAALLPLRKDDLAPPLDERLDICAKGVGIQWRALREPRLVVRLHQASLKRPAAPLPPSAF